MRPLLALLAALLPLWPLSTWDEFRHNIGNNAVVRGTLVTSWKVQTRGSFSSSPSEAGGAIFIGNNAGMLYKIDARTGDTMWTYQTKASLMTDPLVVDGSVIVGEGNQTSYVDQGGLTKVGTSENAVIAVDEETGREQWRVPLAGTGMPTPALLGTTLVEHDGSGDVTGIDVKTGRVLYKQHVAGAASMVAMLPVSKGRFITQSVSPNSVWEIDGSNGHVVWEHRFPDNSSGLSDCPPAADRNRAFCDYEMPAPGAQRAHVGQPAVEHVFAVDIGSGKLLWDVPVATGELPQWNEAAIPLVYKRIVYVGSSISPRVQALDPVTGRILWQRTVNGAVKGGICGNDGVLYLGDYAGYLWAINAQTGAVVGEKNMHTIFNVGSPLIAGETLVVGTKTGEVLAVPLNEILTAHDPAP